MVKLTYGVSHVSFHHSSPPSGPTPRRQTPAMNLETLETASSFDHPASQIHSNTSNYTYEQSNIFLWKKYKSVCHFQEKLILTHNDHVLITVKDMVKIDELNIENKGAQYDRLVESKLI